MFERKLRSWRRPDAAAAEKEGKDDAADHGVQRWQQGYLLREVIREWGHLQRGLLHEIDAGSWRARSTPLTRWRRRATCS